MTEAFFMMLLLIAGPKLLGNSIPVYLQPLLDELKVLRIDSLEI